MRCLVVADFYGPLGALREVLERLDVEVVEVDRIGFDWLTETPAPPIDFVCAVLRSGDRRGPEDAVFLDIGVALGRGIPVLLVVEPGRKTPLVLAGLTRLEAGLNNADALGLHVGQFLRALHREPAGQRPVERDLSLSTVQARIAHERLDELSSHGVTRPDGDEFERFIYGLLEAQSGELSSQPFSHDGGWDMAVWPGLAGSVLGSPIMLQVKLWSSEPKHGLTNAIEAFSQQINKQQVPLGLMIYHSTVWRSTDQAAARQPVLSGAVAAISAHAFIDALANGTFSRLLIGLRNSIVHGVRYFA